MIFFSKVTRIWTEEERNGHVSRAS